MKRLFVFVLIALILCGINFGITKNLTLENIFKGACVEVYLKSQCETNEFLSIKNGAGEIIFSEIENLNYILNNYDANGFTIKIKNEQIDNVIKKLNANYLFESFNCLYGCSSLFVDCACVNNNLVNFQCVKNEDEILIGSPLLLGSY